MMMAALALAGCKTEPEPKQIVVLKPQPDSRITFSPGLHNAIQLVRVTAGRGPGGFYNVQINLQNISKELQRISYTVVWVDEAGEVLHLPPGPVLPWTLMKGEVTSLTVTAPTPQARDFRMEFFEIGQLR